MEQRIYTVGHSNHAMEAFVALLERHAIEVLIDVRSQPYSKYASQFNPKELEAVLVTRGIKYLFLGKELGGRPSEPEYYDAEGHVLYWRLAESSLFLQGISRLEKGIEQYCVALMCSEEDPLECHRHLLVASVLRSKGIAIHHIRGDGSIQTEEDLLNGEVKRGIQGVQLELFQVQEEETEWRSTRSVLRKEQPLTSLEH